MKIAQVAPLHESVPPRTYGGAERVVHYLTEELVRQGHEVTLFASGDSQTCAELHPVVPEALRLGCEARDPALCHTLQLGALTRSLGAFDIVHFHVDYLHFPLSRLLPLPHVTTLHNRLDLPLLPALFGEFGDVPVVSISDAQRGPLPMAGWAGTVHNGLPETLYRFEPRPAGDYLAFLGRFSPVKGAETAIDIALRSGLPLKMAAKLDPGDQAYFDARIRPHLRHPLIEYVGEVDDEGKSDLLGGARALLFPIVWPEPFGLVMVEAMACGTPVVAFRQGAVPEVMADGVSGYVVDDLAEAVAAVERIDRIDRTGCRAHFETRFSARRMAEGYLAVYRRQIEARRALGCVPELGLHSGEAAPQRAPHAIPTPVQAARVVSRGVDEVPANAPSAAADGGASGE
jgi:glycosyltransferase involved in cell wall biosynthesis